MDRIFRYQPILLIILITVISILYIAAVSSYWKITPDSSVYVSAAKSLAEGDGYKIHGSSVKLYPPVTSIIYAISFLAFPDSYLSLNILTTIFVLLAVYISYFLFKDEIGKLKSGTIVLLSLGSVNFFEHSTYLLSDNIFIFFCFLSLLYAKKVINDSKSIYDYLFFVSATLSACFTRIVGAAIPMSMLCYLISSYVFNKSKASRSLIYIVLITLIGVYIWESIQQLTVGYSYLKLFSQSHQWIPQEGYTSLKGLFRRFDYNLTEYLKIGLILSNGLFTQLNFPGVVNKLIHLFLLILFLTGLVISLIRKVTIIEIYTVMMLLIIGFYAHPIQTRWLFPILPIIFYYFIIPVKLLHTKAIGYNIPHFDKISQVLLRLFISLYIGYSIFFMIGFIPGEHSSPFEQYPIKYSSNYDVQELAMWLKNNTDKNDLYAAQHTEMLDIISDRTGITIPHEKDPLSLINRLERNKVKYVILDKTKIDIGRFLLPVLSKYPDKFILIKELPDADLFRLKS